MTTISSHANFALFRPQPNAPTATGGTKSGTVSNSKNGDGTFQITSSDTDGQKIVDKSVTYANGTTKSSERTVTVNADGSKTIVKTGAGGKTTTIQESQSRNADGTMSLSKEITKANGKTTDVTGTVTKSDGETDKSLVYTNAKGVTQTVDEQTTQNGNITSHMRTGTGYKGNTIDSSSTWQTIA
jgi:hypothetical protein